MTTKNTFTETPVAHPGKSITIPLPEYGFRVEWDVQYDVSISDMLMMMNPEGYADEIDAYLLKAASEAAENARKSGATRVSVEDFTPILEHDAEYPTQLILRMRWSPATAYLMDPEGQLVKAVKTPLDEKGRPDNTLEDEDQEYRFTCLSSTLGAAIYREAE